MYVPEQDILMVELYWQLRPLAYELQSAVHRVWSSRVAIESCYAAHHNSLQRIYLIHDGLCLMGDIDSSVGKSSHQSIHIPLFGKV